MKLSGAQIVIERLCENGVSTVFGYPGGTVLPLYDALYKSAHRIRHVITAHEQGAAHAADGFARASGKTGVVIATSGPGATNLVTGIANAYLDSVPLVAITGNVTTALLGKDSFQEVDIGGVTQPIVKHSFIARDIGELAHLLSEAFRIANSGRRGPVLVDIPKNIQEALCEYTPSPPAVEPESPPSVDVSAALEALALCKRPFIYAGGGVSAAGAERELLELSKRLSAPVGLSMMGLASLPASYPLNLGMCGMHGKYAATMAQNECDLVIALGVRFSDRATGKTSEYSMGRTIIHVDIDSSEFGKNVSTTINLLSDVKTALTALLERLPPSGNDAWLARIDELKAVETSPSRGDLTPQSIVEAVRAVCDDDAIIATDVGQHQMWVAQSYAFERPRTLLTSGGLGAMGFGLGAAIGGCIASGGKRTVLFTGDGSFGMNLTELATAVTEELPLTVVILNNGVLGMVRQWQSLFYEQRYSSTTLRRKTDFAALAKAFGADGHTVLSLPQLAEALACIPANRPVVIDCHIDKDELVLPMIPPGGSAKDIVMNR